MKHLLPIVARNSFFGAFGKLAIKAISFLFTVFIIRWLGDESYGQYTLVTSYVLIFAMLSDAGLSMYALREIAKARPNSQYLIGSIIVLRLILAVFTIGLIMVSAWLLGYSRQFLEYIFLSSLILLLYAVQDPLDTLLQAHERFDLAATASVIGQLVFVAAGAVFLLSGWHITGLIVAALLNVLVAMLIAGYLLGPYQQNFQWQLQPAQWPKFLQSSFSFGVIKLWLSWSLKIDIIILGWFWVDKMVGWYGAAYAIITGLTLIANAINAALYPTLSRQHSFNPQQLPKIYEVSTKYLLIISLPLAGGIFLTAGLWVNFLYGPEFAPTTWTLTILIWVVPLAFISEQFRYILLVTDQERTAAQILGLVVLFNLAFNVWLIPVYGLLGAALVAVATEAALVGLYALALKPHLESINWVDALLKPMLATGLMMLVIAFIGTWPDTRTEWFTLPVQCIVGGLVYIALLWLLGTLEPYEYRPLLTLLNRKMIRNNPRVDVQPAAKISVFIPAYNAEKFIAQAIESVLNQRYQQYELIIIDDGSVDHTATIIKQYQAHPQVRVVHNSQNMGMAPTWNIGLQQCRGDVVAKLDADDFYHPHYLETMAAFFERHPTVGLVFSGTHLVYPENRIESEMYSLRSWVKTRRKFLPELLKLCVIRSPTVCARHECYQELGTFVDSMRIHADWEMWVRIAANSPVGFVARILSSYRMSYGDNITAQAASEGFSQQDIQIWLNLLHNKVLPYQLTPEEWGIFRWGIYELEMHFAAIAAYYKNPAMQQHYTAFAEQQLPQPLPPAEMEQMRQAYTQLHQGICAFRENQLKEARHYFLQALKANPVAWKSSWVWNKLFLTYVGRTKWGIMYK